jgi:DNA-binding transcriptional MocR family regulator
MFIWLKLLGVEDADEVTGALLEERVVVTPGRAFWTRRDEPGARCPHIRLCFVYVGREELVAGIARLRSVLLQSAGKAR